MDFPDGKPPGASRAVNTGFMASIKKELPFEPYRVSVQVLQVFRVPKPGTEMWADFRRHTVAEIVAAWFLPEGDMDVVIVLSLLFAIDGFAAAHVGMMGIPDIPGDLNQGAFSNLFPSLVL